MEKVKCNWKKKYLLGSADGEKIYLSAPSFDCGWYWGFGYLGNNNCHYHLSGLNNGKNQCLHDAIEEHFNEKDSIFKHDRLLWTFTELVKTAYGLKDSAEILGRGGSAQTTNPLADIIKNESEVKRINEVVLPSIFNEIEQTLIKMKDHDKFLKSESGRFVLTDGYHNLCLEIMTWEQITEFMQWRKDQGFRTDKDRVMKIRKGENFKNGKGGDLVKLYDIKSGQCHVMLENKDYADSANEKLKHEIIKYRKG